MKAPSRFLNKSKSEDLFKEIAGVERFESDVWKHIESLCFAYFVELAKLAGDRVQADDRTVIAVEDVQPPTGSGSVVPTPDVLLEQLHGLDVAAVAQFSKLISQWVDKQKS